MMELKVERKAYKKEYTIGRLYVNGVYFCDTLEDIVRKDGAKVWGKTAIPAGRYRVTMRVKSPKFSRIAKYGETGGYMPRLLNVPDFEGILIHPGNRHTDTDGCILVGENKRKGEVVNSTGTFWKLWALLRDADHKGDEIWIEVKNG